MMRNARKWLLPILLWACFGNQAAAQSDMPPAPITHDEGGTLTITGFLDYTDPLFTDGVAEPLIVLEDQAGFVDRNRYYLMPQESQVLGQYTSNFYQSPVSYSLSLPQIPNAPYRDVDHDGIDETGVQIYAVAFWENVFGDPYLEQRDLYGGGWSTAYASTRVSDDPALEDEIVGGKYVVYAPDDQQGFPSDFGADGKLFTGDDPIVRLPQGYTVVDLDTSPFTFDRSAHADIDLYEPEGAVLVDYTNMGLVEGFDAMIAKMRREYAYTDYKHIDWDALSAEFRPRFAQAQRDASIQEYLLALRDFNWSIPDGHVAFGAEYYLSDLVDEETGGGVGMTIRELDDGRAIVTYLTASGPAQKAGIELGAEILTYNGLPTSQAAEQVVPWNSPFSSDHVRRLEQFHYLTRSPVGTQVEVTYRNPDSSGDQTATLTSIRESSSFEAGRISRATTGYELPVEYSLLPSGYVYAKINSFSDNKLLTIQLWERLMQDLNGNAAPGLIIDMRENLGGSGYLADQMAAYLFDEPLVLGRTYSYDEFSDSFYSDPRGIETYYLPAPEKRYLGAVAVLVGPDCNSACEFFAYDLTLEDRSSVVGEYPTAGLGGGIRYFLAPLGIFFQFTGGRAVDADENIHIEGKGVQPTVRVPVNEETVFSTGDPVLEAAIRHLDETGR